MVTKSKYTNGLDMSQFKHIPEISTYNNNYYVGFGGDLLFCRSDDIDTGKWYLVRKMCAPVFLGDTYCGSEVLDIDDYE